MFVVQAVMGGMEVSATRRRVTRRNKAAAEQGKVHGGKRAFGWEPDKKTLRPFEAELLGDAIRAIPKGKTVGMVRKEWVAAGIGATAEGKGPLKDHTVLMRLINPRVCGYRTYVPKEARREAGGNLWTPDHILYVDDQPVIGDWTPIVTPDEWAACVATLEARRDKDRTNEFTRLHAKYLLSGIVRCGECGTRMYGAILPGDTKHRYRCKPQEGGCAKITRIGPPLDELVQRLYLEETRKDLGPVEHDVDDSIYDARIRELREEIKEVMARRRPDHPKRISTATAMDLLNDLEAEMADLTYKARALTAAKVKRQQDTPSVLAEWDSYTIDMKRDHLRRDISAVVVNRAGKGALFNPDLIEVVWAS